MNSATPKARLGIVRSATTWLKLAAIVLSTGVMEAVVSSTNITSAWRISGVKGTTSTVVTRGDSSA